MLTFASVAENGKETLLDKATLNNYIVAFNVTPSGHKTKEVLALQVN